MTDLDPDVMGLYSSVAYSSDKLLMHDTGIDQIVPGATLDSKIFEPCGFSVNAIIKVDVTAFFSDACIFLAGNIILGAGFSVNAGTCRCYCILL